MPADYAIPEDKPNRTIIIVVAIVAALLIGGFFWLLLRGTMGGPQVTQLQGAVKPGAPEWDQYSKRIVLDEPADCPEPGAPFCAVESKRALGDIVMTLRATVRNFTGRTVTGLEVRASVVDHQNQPVRQKTLVVIPGPGREELAPNKTTTIAITIDGFTENDDRANTKMEVTGFRLR
jgi:hypothetical protein